MRWEICRPAVLKRLRDDAEISVSESIDILSQSDSLSTGEISSGMLLRCLHIGLLRAVAPLAFPEGIDDVPQGNT